MEMRYFLEKRAENTVSGTQLRRKRIKLDETSAATRCIAVYLAAQNQEGILALRGSPANLADHSR